jgi:hypothetical protein
VKQRGDESKVVVNRAAYAFEFHSREAQDRAFAEWAPGDNQLARTRDWRFLNLVQSICGVRGEVWPY